MAAVDQHSKFREDPWGRLERTTHFVMATTYGDTAAAEAAAARVRAVHARIHGVDPVTGRSYSGSDPDLLLWIHAVEVESFLLVYRTYAGRLSRRRRRPVRRRDGARRRDGRAARGTWCRDRWARCATTSGRCAGLQATPAARRRPARRPVPADAPRSTARCGRSPRRPRSRSCPATRVACTACRGFPAPALPVRAAVFAAQPGVEPGDADRRRWCGKRANAYTRAAAA